MTKTRLITHNIASVTKLKQVRLCPNCKKVIDTRVPRGIIIKTFFFWLPLKRYICYSCQRKSYKWS